MPPTNPPHGGYPTGGGSINLSESTIQRLTAAFQTRGSVVDGGGERPKSVLHQFGEKKLRGVPGISDATAKRWTDKVSKFGEGLNRGFALYLGVTAALRFVGRILGDFNKLQVQSLAVGRRLSNVYSESVVAYKNIPAGMGIIMQEQIASMQVGFRGTNTGLVSLGVAMKATGQSSDLLYSTMADAVALGGLSNEQMNTLSKNMLSMQEAGLATTTQMLNAMAALKGSLTNAKMLGIGDQVTESVTTMTALLPKSAELMTVGMNKLLSTNMSDLTGIMLLGQRQQHADFTRGRLGTIGTMKMMLDLGGRFEKHQEGMGGLENALIGLGAAQSGYAGEIGQPLAAWKKSFEEKYGKGIEGIKNAAKEIVLSRRQSEKFRDSMEIWNSVIWDPLKRVGLKLFSVIMEWMAKYGKITAKLISTLMVSIAINKVLSRITAIGARLSGATLGATAAAGAGGLAAGGAAGGAAGAGKKAAKAAKAATGASKFGKVASRLHPIGRILAALGAGYVVSESIFNMVSKEFEQESLDIDKLTLEELKNIEELMNPLSPATINASQLAHQNALNAVFTNFLGSNTPQMQVLMDIREHTGTSNTWLQFLTQEQKEAVRNAKNRAAMAELK